MFRSFKKTELSQWDINLGEKSPWLADSFSFWSGLRALCKIWLAGSRFLRWIKSCWFVTIFQYWNWSFKAHKPFDLCHGQSLTGIPETRKSMLIVKCFCTNEILEKLHRSDWDFRNDWYSVQVAASGYDTHVRNLCCMSYPVSPHRFYSIMIPRG